MEAATVPVLAGLTLLVTMMACVRRVVIHSAYVGLLYRNGKFKRTLAPGRHFIWRPGARCEIYDLRRQTLTIPGQDVLSKDNIGLKISLVVSFDIAEARAAVETVQDYTAELYIAAQLALRSALAEQTMDEILANRAQISRQVLPVVAGHASAFGLRVHAVEIKDTMFPGELKRIFAEVARAREEGRASLEKARGESAALRNLANAARLLESNPALMNLRLLQSISAASSGTGNTLVLGVPQGLTSLPHGNHADSTRRNADDSAD